MNDLAQGIDELARLIRGVGLARGVTVWGHCRHKLEVVSAWGARQADYNLALVVWQRDRADLQDGRTVTCDEAHFLPLLSPHRDLVGVLELAEADLDRPGRRHFLDTMLDELGRQLAVPLPKAVPELLTVPVKRLVARDGGDFLLRAMHEALLDRFGWNVARVAEELGLPRQTLQNQLRRLNVRRPEPSSKSRRGQQLTRRPTIAELEPALRAALWPRLPVRPAGQRT